VFIRVHLWLIFLLEGRMSKIAIRLESLAVPLRQALKLAQQAGVGGVQVDAAGDLAPGNLTQTGRREFRNLLRAYNLELTAVGCPLRRGLDVPEYLEARIEHVRNVLSLAFDLGPRVVVVDAGRIRDDEKAPGAAFLRESLLALGQHGDRVGSKLALETGLNDGPAVKKYLDGFDTGSLAVNFDPANLVVHGFNPHAAVHELYRYLAHAHARDARPATANRAAAEVPLGHGDIDWMQLTADLAAVEYRGWLTVDRESGDNRVADVAAGVKFLRRLMG
jgi:sugar phosphate isomerase/epimerase